MPLIWTIERENNILQERLQKILSACGLTSRRGAEGWINEGRVTVNGEVAQLGQRADIEVDTIAVDGVSITKDETRHYYMLNKPRGFVTTMSDEQGRKTVRHLMEGCGMRVWPVGRLDLDSEGLLLMTDDGDLTQKLTHPSHEVEKEYLVWVTGDTHRGVPMLCQPMELDGEKVNPAKVRRGRENGSITQLSISITQGKNRQVRRMCLQAGLKVMRLKRVREGDLMLDRTLKTGEWRPLTPDEVAVLKREKS